MMGDAQARGSFKLRASTGLSNNRLMVRKTQPNKLLQEICHNVYRCPAGCNREKIH
jgi:hypothetical protein